MSSATLAFSFMRADWAEIEGRGARDERVERDLRDRLSTSNNLSKRSLIFASHSKTQLTTSFQYSNLSLSLPVKWWEACSLSSGEVNTS